jgi:hypothetical protein
MLYETLTTEHGPHRAQLALSQLRAVAHGFRWRSWRLTSPEEPEVLTSAELSECACPEICHRDHERD